MVRVGSKRRGDHGLYVGRPSKFGNPFAMRSEAEREVVIEKYRSWFIERLNDREFALDALELRDATALVCWCAPLPCHADVLEEFVNQL